MRPRRARDADNSFGRGYYKPPARILSLGRYVDNLTPSRLVRIRVYPDEGVWLLDAKADERFSIMKLDLESLLRQGLIRMQVNRPGTITFYFQDKPIAGPSRDRHLRMNRRRA